jgi:glycosyltransferase involved in cell wall biosynthesis
MVCRFADAVLVSEPEMVPWIPGAMWIPQPLDLEYWTADTSLLSVKNDGVINIGHAPTNRAKKGTLYVERAVQALQGKGYPVQLEIIENMSYKHVKRCYQRADIFVDQLLCGWYGNASCEAMALEKPVCCYVRSDLFSFLRSCPIVNVTAETLECELIALIQDRDLRAKLGRRGRQYVAEVHDVMKIAAQCIEIYQRA